MWEQLLTLVFDFIGFVLTDVVLLFTDHLSLFVKLCLGIILISIIAMLLGMSIVWGLTVIDIVLALLLLHLVMKREK